MGPASGDQFEEVTGLTPRQKEMYVWLIRFICEHGYQPNLDEWAAQFEVFKNSIVGVLGQLTKKGLLGQDRSRGQACLTLNGVRFTANINSEVVGKVREPLTTEAAEALWTIVKSISKNGFQPNKTELRELLDLTAIRVESLLDEMIAKGYVRRGSERQLGLVGVEFLAEFDPTKMEDIDLLG